MDNLDKLTSEEAINNFETDTNIDFIKDPYIWIDKFGTLYKIWEMDIDHLKNVFNYLVRYNYNSVQRQVVSNELKFREEELFLK